MAIKVKKKPNMAKYIKAIEGMSDKALPLEIQETIVEIQQRTRKGTDVKGGSFKPYTSKYAKRKVEEYGSADVNLTQTGNMLHSMTYKKITNGVKIFFGATEENKKAYHNQVTNNRTFFGLDKVQHKRLLNAISKYWKKTK